MNGSCHCGSVTIEITEKPEYLNQCNCSLCTGTGAVWGYFARDQIQIEGETTGYHRADFAEPSVELHFCVKCGNTTHWQSLSAEAPDRMGANMRLFPIASLHSAELRFPDGRSWDSVGEYGYRRPAVTISAANQCDAWDDFF